MLWWLYFKLSSLFVTQRVVLVFMVCCVKTLAALIALTPQNVTVSPGSVTWAVWRAGSAPGVTRVRHVILHFVLFEKKCIFAYWSNTDLFLNWFYEIVKQILKKTKEKYNSCKYRHINLKMKVELLSNFWNYNIRLKHGVVFI